MTNNVIKQMLASFNPRARDGRERDLISGIASCLCFNPRARDGRESQPRNSEGSSSGFNPRARDGRE